MLGVRTAPTVVFVVAGALGIVAGAAMLIWRTRTFGLFGRFFRNEYYDLDSPKSRYTMIVSHTIAPAALIAISAYAVVYALVN